MTDKSTRWLVVLIFVFGLLIRFYNLNPLMTFTYDQGRDMIELAKIANGDLTLIGPTTGIPGFYLGPFHFYALLPGFILGGGSPFGVAYWNAFIITLALPLAFFLLKPLVGKKLALLSYSWLMILPGAVENARRIWNPSFTASILLVMTFCLFKSVAEKTKEKHRTIWLSSAVFSFGLALQTELAYVVFLTPVLLWWLATHWKSTYSIKTILIAGATGATTLLPQLLFEVRNNFLLSRSLLNEILDTTKQVSYLTVWQQRPSEMFAALSSQFFPGVTERALLMSVLLALLIFLIVKMKKTKEVGFLILWLITPLVGMMFFRGNHGYFFDYYISSLYLPFILLLTIGLQTFNTKRQLISSVVISLAFIYSFSALLPSIVNKELLGYTIGHQYQALETIRQTENKHDPVGIDVFVPNLLPVQYQYLNQQLNQKIAQPQVEILITGDHMEYYLISEPAFEGASEMAHQEWRERATRNADCRVIDSYGIVTLEKCTRY